MKQQAAVNPDQTITCSIHTPGEYNFQTSITIRDDSCQHPESSGDVALYYK